IFYIYYIPLCVVLPSHGINFISYSHGLACLLLKRYSLLSLTNEVRSKSSMVRPLDVVPYIQLRQYLISRGVSSALLRTLSSLQIGHSTPEKSRLVRLIDLIVLLSMSEFIFPTFLY